MFCAAVVAGTAAATATAALAFTPSAAAVPLVQGLTLISAASERQGDYESTLLIEGIDEEGTTHLIISAELPDPAGRAAAVRTALVARGISEKRETTAGHGAASRRDTNATLPGRTRNRRVELTRQ